MGSIKVYGTPVQKGNMICMGQRGARKHAITDKGGDALDAWQKKITAAAIALRNKIGRIDGPVSISVTITLERPKTVRRGWPITRAGGDLDKHVRSVGDALAKAELINDDSQICHIETWQCYPDTPGCPDRLDRPGALIRIDPIEEP